MPPAPGTMITTSVRLLEPLGHGAMGSVWVAEHLALETRVAVKLIAGEAAEHDPTLVERFRREARLAAHIRSPHIVQTFDHGVTPEGTPFIVMELLAGEDLGARLERGPLPAPDVARMLTQVASALARAHQNDIVHRDIKPENLFLVAGEEELYTKVLDFGVARHTPVARQARLTAPGVVVGTPYYMSPEQILTPEAVDARSDQWSLAVVAYHALTGALPFFGATMPALVAAICSAGFAPAGTHVDGLAPAVDAWFSRALARKPAARFGSIKEAATAFRRALEGNVSAALPPARPPEGLFPALELDLPSTEPDAPSKPAPASRAPAPLTSASVMDSEPPDAGAIELDDGRPQRSGDAAATPVRKTLGAVGMAHDAAASLSGVGFTPRSVARPSFETAPAPAAPGRARQAASWARARGPWLLAAVVVAALVLTPVARSLTCKSGQACASEGKCSTDYLTCVVGSARDCEQSERCRRLGQCTLAGGMCVVESAYDCQRAEVCTEGGLCAFDQGRCVTPAHPCRSTSVCHDAGYCSLVDGECVASSDEDCASSVLCKDYGSCRARDGRCVP